MENPKLSIIIPTYNSAKTIAQTLDSVIDQTFTALEVLVLDGLSVDETCAIVKSYAKEHPFITLFSEKDAGVYDAMNKGIELSKGDYLYFLGSDDIFYTNETLAKLFSNFKASWDVIYGNVLFKNSGHVYSGESNLEKLVYEQVSICHQAIFYSKRTFDIVGKFNTKYFIHADYDFNIRCFKSEELSIQFVDQIIAIFNEGGLSGVNSNADGFHTELTEKNVRERYDVVALFHENENLNERIKFLEERIKFLENSLNYWVGDRLLKPFRFINKLLK